ncbi:uncharacterized protein LOC130591063 [Beta vulgaris subsp. vulgaris]|uniref:uncharacterized protein LOC130591063 n=1 Tax=Beta vulgaris subsp. vulgaris TaxID=3555 RepID=UPI0025488694|nr:uncharacterized protein LOC130591063 [Beta vulgaris subsp. vulgaris]
MGEVAHDTRNPTLSLSNSAEESGSRFTWTNNRESEDFIMERLDRGYASSDWMIGFPETHIRDMPIIHSDHGPILLQLTIPTRKPRRPYQGSKVQHFTPILDKVSKTISSWNHINISESAKVIIINAILDRHGKGIHWKNKSVIQRPKHMGALVSECGHSQ